MTAFPQSLVLAAAFLLAAFAVDAGEVETRNALDAGRYTRALELAQSLAEERPTDSTAWRLYARALEETGDYTGALTALERAVELGAGPQLSAEVAAARLESLFGRSGAAQARLRGVVAAGNGHASLSAEERVAVGDAYRELARSDPALFGAALDSYEAAIQRDPASPQPHVAMGELLLDRYNNAEALEAFRAALALDDGYAPALLGLARSQRFDRSPGAESTLRTLLERSPDFVPARVLLARLLIESEHYDEAEREVRRALTVNPRSPEALTAAAAVHFLRDDDERFATGLREIHRIAPGYSTVFQTLAEVAAQNRRYRDALEFALRRIGAEPRAWRSHAAAGENRLRLGDMDSGRRSLEEAFRGDPYDVRTKNTLDLLDRLDGFDTARSEHFELVAAPGEARVLAAELLPVAETAYAFFSERYGIRPATPIRVEVYSRHEDFSVRTVGLVGVDILGVCFGPVIALDSPSAGAFGPFNWASATWHEIAHTFHLELSRSRVPRWFSEGLAVYEERRARPGWGMDVSPGFLRAFHQGRLAPASDMNQAFLRPRYPEQTVHAYYQASLVMEMIEQRRGFDAIVAMLRGYAKGRSTAELLTEVAGMSPRALDAAFDDFVRNRFGRSLDGLFARDGGGTPYGALLKQGRDALERGDPAAAREPLRRALELFPDHAGPGSAYRLLAAAEENAGAPRDAIDLLRRAIDIDADDLEGHRQLARLYRQQGEPEQAAAVMQRTLLIQPFDPAIHEDIAEIRESRADWAAAVPARAAVVALEPVDEAGARFRLARALDRSGNTAEARHEVLRALEVAPMYEEALELLLAVREELAEEGDRGETQPGATR